MIAGYATCREKLTAQKLAEYQSISKEEAAQQMDEMKDLLREDDPQQLQGDARGNTGISEVNSISNIQIFGCEVGLGVKATTTMLKDIFDQIILSIDLRTQTYVFPKCLD